MSADNRTTHTDALATLGTLSLSEQDKRDAIHLAVEPVVAGEILHPGEHVGLFDGVATTRSKHLGIVDPFIEGEVLPGQRFWLVVYPRQITSLRHVWEHPDFPASGETEKKDVDAQAAWEWMEQYAASLGKYADDYEGSYYDVTAEELMSYADTWIKPNSRYGGDWLVKGGLLEGVSIHPDFWDYYEKIRGTRPEENVNFFSCSC